MCSGLIDLYEFHLYEFHFYGAKRYEIILEKGLIQVFELIY